MSFPAHATTPLPEKLCTYSSAIDVPIEQIIAASSKFDCSDNKYSVTGPRVWIMAPFTDDGLPDGAVEVQGDNNGLTTMAVHSVLLDGSILSKNYSLQEVKNYWRPKGHYGLPVPGSEKVKIRQNIQSVYVAIDNPRVISSISLMDFASKQAWDDLTLPLSVMFGILCGMTIMPFIYNSFFYSALRHNFMLWHSAMVAGTVVYTFSSSGLIFIAFPEFCLQAKMLLNYWTLAICIAASGFFMISFVESGTFSKPVKTLIIATCTLPLFVTAIVMQFNDGYSMDARNQYHASFIPYLGVVIFAMVYAVRNGSRAIWFQIAGWSPIIFFAMDRIARGMDLYVGMPILDYGLYFALVLENIILAFGVAKRILQLRRRHEKTLRKQVELTLLAETDGLTAIGNRRAFESAFGDNQFNREYDHLAIIDIDFFKKVNDEYGHEVGDDVLRIVGQELAKTDHLAGRIGGEEFALLLRSDERSHRRKSPAAEMTGICEQLIKAVSRGVPELKAPVTFSAGVARIKKYAPLRDVMAIADKRLYNAKDNGRNQVVCFDVSSSSGEPEAKTVTI